jgi:streptogramin lyase
MTKSMVRFALVGASLGWLITASGCSGDAERGNSYPGRTGGSGGAGGRNNDRDSGLMNPDIPDGGFPQFDGGGSAPDSGDCGSGCVRSETGPGTDKPFDLDDNPNEGVGVDPDGALVLERDDSEAQTLIWIANTSEFSVSKVDTVSFTELGRYLIPGVDQTNNPGENGPSRTSVDSEGSVYAGARYGNGVSKVSAAAEDCPDTNGDGMITTSTGVGDLLPIGEDDCVLWTTNIDGDARGVAVQEIPARFEVEQVPDSDPIITEIPGAKYLWVGGHDTERLHKLDAETGEILFTLDEPPSAIYGLALDGRGNLWTVAQKEGAFGRIDTARCVDDSCNDETVCVTRCSQTSCPTDCDDAIIERIEPLDDGDNAMSSYGITVDCNQRVWLGGAYGSIGVKRYDPLADANERLSLVTMIAGNNANGVNGIAADASGFIWGAAGDTGVWRIDSDSLDFFQVPGTAAPDGQAKGIAVDRQGKIWAIPLRDTYATVITPGVMLDEATVDRPIDGFVGPYTYSDMSGEQRRLSANDPGSYRQLFEGCASDQDTEWVELAWDVETPMGTTVVFRGRTADSVADLEDAEWFNITALPGRDGPRPLPTIIASVNQEPGRYFEIDVQLITTELGSTSKDGCSVTPATTPRVKGFSVTHVCPLVLE